MKDPVAVCDVNVSGSWLENLKWINEWGSVQLEHDSHFSWISYPLLINSGTLWYYQIASVNLSMKTQFKSSFSRDQSRKLATLLTLPLLFVFIDISLISADNWLVSISYPAVRKEAQRHQTDNKELLRSPMSWSKTCTWTYCKDDRWLRENNSPYNQVAVFCSRHSQSGLEDSRPRINKRLLR